MGLISGKTNIFDKETLIFEDGDEVSFVAFIKEGSVIKEGDTEETLSAGDFIGIKDLYNGFYSGDYTAMSGASILPLCADSPLGLYDFLCANPQLHMSLSYELCIYIKKLYEMYQSLYNDIEDFYSSILSMHERYIDCCKKSNTAPKEFLFPHPATDYKFSQQDFYKNYSVFNELSNSRPKAHTFIKANGEKFLKVQADLIRDMYTAYDDMVYYLKTIISLFASKSDRCLFSLTASLADIASSQYKSMILQLLNDMKNVIISVDEDLRNNSGLMIDIDYNRVNFYFMMVENMQDADETNINSDHVQTASDSNEPDDYSSSEDDASMDVLAEKKAHIDVTGTLQALCSFAGFDEKTTFIYESAINTFRRLPDKASKDDSVRRFRKEFNELYFKLYEEVFMNYAKASDKSQLKLVELFLDFGFMDERLLSDSQIEFLLSIPEITPCEPCGVYRMKDWLLRIYNNEDVPSKNEFDMDYVDSIRERKKNEAITTAKEKELLNNNELKTRFEIQNLLKCNLRLVNGNVLTCFPMLHMDCFERDIRSMVLSSETINNTVKALLDIDYSIFYREILYSDMENKIPKATIQKEIFPQFILFPTVGVNGIMWQETSGKKISSSGRFLLPSLFLSKIEDVMLTLFARFRFELCKTLYGSSWNNIQVPSLTSEYSDYIQFYRKNKELSVEKKEALKNQISRCRNNMREIFVYDYIIHIRYESAGAIRLNKVSRRILATYCPYSKDIRAKLANQPIFAEAMNKYQRENLKKTKEINNLIFNLQRGGATITDELLITKRFYEEL